ncbi:MAG: dienelactone hydrolase family protein [Pirellulaceae bacterium]|nr:dienelactone hydrolase family protein [Pirellulaceae bacterium]
MRLSYVLAMCTAVVSQAAVAQHIVCVTVEDPLNYQAVSFLNDFALRELSTVARRVTIVQGNQVHPTRFDGLETPLQDADLLIVFVRRATPPEHQLNAIRSHLEAGKPLVGIRTANHAFAPLPNTTLPDGASSWPEFVPDVLGCQNTGYETQGMPYAVTLHPSAQPTDPLLDGVDYRSISGHTSMYRVLPLADDAQPLLLGRAVGIEPAQPIAWTRLYGPKQAKVFYSSLGDPVDVQQPAVRKLFLNAVKWALQSSSQSSPQPQITSLPGTEPLVARSDLADAMISGIDRFLLRQIDTIAGQRRAQERHVVNDHDATSEATDQPQARQRTAVERRSRLAEILGVRDARPDNLTMEIQGTTSHSGTVAHGTIAGHPNHHWHARLVRWNVLDGVHGEGLLIEPQAGRPASLDVVLLPDADQTPEQLLGIAEGVPADLQYARILAATGCRVIVPTLISNAVAARAPPGQAGRAVMTNREYVYRPAFELGRHVIGYEIQKTLAAVDWLSALPDRHACPIAVAGYGEGGLIALTAAALDRRIDAALVSGYFGPREGMWQEPISRNLFGILSEFGDAELAQLIFPRPLLVDFRPGPELSLRTAGGAPGDLPAHRPDLSVAEFQQAAQRMQIPLEAPQVGQPPRAALLSGTVTRWYQNVNDVRALDAINNSSGPLSAVLPLKALVDSRHITSNTTLVDPLPDADRRQARQVAELIEHTQHLLQRSPSVRQSLFAKLDTQSLDAYQMSIEPYREMFYDQVIGRFDLPRLPAAPRSRLWKQTNNWTGYEVVLDVWPDVIAYGILLLPNDLTTDQRHPVVVCQHGLEGRPADVVVGDHPAYHDFAAKLCERGYIVFAPQNIYLFQDRFRSLQRKSNSIGKTLFSTMVPQHQQIVDWLKSLPQVDPQRIAFYGLSYGGKSAMRIPALVPDYCLSICSADFNEWIVKNASTREPFSYVWTGEYEIFEFNLGNTFNYAEMSWLICPRPFMVERGHFDAVGEDHWVAYEYAKVRHMYQAKLGIGQRTEIEWFIGPHTINGQATFAFLDRHLRHKARGQ